jgi:hypothetical protein
MYARLRAARMIVVCMYNRTKAETMVGETLQGTVFLWFYDRPRDLTDRN